MIADLVASGRIADLILVLMGLELAGLIVYRRRTGRGIALRDLLPNVLAGACLVLALRAGLTGAGWMWVGMALTGALIAHLADLMVRWPRDR